ncbi:NADPH-dependent diflavin oxidoreductase ATR3-like protein, partial [Trifolium pratense]
DLTSLDILDNARSLHHGNSSSGRSGHPDCFLKMVKNLPLTRPNFGKDVRHFEFEFVSHAIEYDTGDVLEILPGQDSAAADAFIRRCNLDRSSA